MRFNNPLDAITSGQVFVAFFLAAVLTSIVFGFHFGLVFLSALLAFAAVLCTKSYLAPENNFWKHTPTLATLGAAVVLAIASCFTLPVLGWFSVIIFSTVVALPAGRSLSKAFKR